MQCPVQCPVTVSVPRNHVPFRDEWTAWRWAGLRGTGFPTALVQRLSFPGCAAAADRLAEARQRRAAAQEVACDALRASLDGLERSDANQPRRKLLLKSLEKLKKGKLHARLAEVLAAATVDAVVAARDEEAAAQAAFEAAFSQTHTEQSRRLQDIAADARFQEAVLWQNHHAYKTALHKLLDADPADTSSGQRQKEELVAKYVQRYTVKNDTIGFFGPVGWVDWSEDPDLIARVEPADDLLARRTVYFECWAVVELARTLLELEDTRAWLRPQLLPLHTIDDEGRLIHPMGPALLVDDDQIALLDALDGERTAWQLCQDLAADPECGYTTPEEVREQLDHFRREGSLGWDFVLPAGPFTLDAVRDQVESFGDPELRARCLARIDEFEQGRRAIAEAAGDPARLEAAIQDLAKTFTRLTDTAPTRGAGEDYAARTLTYEDCLRAGVVELGPQVRNTIAEPLSLILFSLRWLTREVADAMRQVIEPVLRELSLFHGDEVPVASFWPPMSMQLSNDNVNAFSKDVVSEYQRRWQEILELQPNDPVTEIRRNSADLRARVEEAFAADLPGWEGARYLSPDVMLAAESAEALARGDFHAVLGELHIAYNSLSVWLFGAQHPDIEAVKGLLESDLQLGKFHITGPTASDYITRFGPIIVPRRDRVVASIGRSTDIPAEQRLEPEDLVVVKTDAGVRLRSLVDDDVDLDITEALAHFLTYGIVSRCNILGAADHWPRVWLDNLIAHRESWVFEGRDMDFVHAATPAARFAGARDWWRRHGLPQRVFFRVATELKPIYVDFSSLIYVELMTKAIRATLLKGEDTKVKMAEMSPDLHETWLPDADGQRYTSELRIILTDRIGYDEAAPPSG